VYQLAGRREQSKRYREIAVLKAVPIDPVNPLRTRANRPTLPGLLQLVQFITVYVGATVTSNAVTRELTGTNEAEDRRPT